MYTCHALDSLLDLKKQRLLLSLQSITEDSSGLTDGVEQDGGGGEEEEGEGEREEGGREGSDGSDDLQGIKCRAPMEEVCDYSVDFNQYLVFFVLLTLNLYLTCCVSPLQSWGSVNYHNAVILCREEENDSGKVEEEGVKVSMKIQ